MPSLDDNPLPLTLIVHVWTGLREGIEWRNKMTAPHYWRIRTHTPTCPHVCTYTRKHVHTHTNRRTQSDVLSQRVFFFRPVPRAPALPPNLNASASLWSSSRPADAMNGYRIDSKPSFSSDGLLNGTRLYCQRTTAILSTLFLANI